MSPWGAWLAHAWPALLLSATALLLLHVSRDPKIPRGNVVLIDLGLGLVTAGASVFWLRVFALALG